LTPRVGPCAQSCDLCGRICPTGAIEPFDWREKKWLYIGRAQIDRSTCIAWYADRKCLVCDEYCSYNAIYWEEEEGAMRPFVDEARCIGCGLCEAFCPIQPQAAIRVHSLGDKRELSRPEQLDIRKGAEKREDTPEDPDVESARYRTIEGKPTYIPPEGL
jgi:formate hydrogenlyase subunit 6/NADH:ubiquinone oxidoreductase subunit I